MDTVVIRNDRNKLIGLSIISGSLILYYFIGPYEYTRTLYATSPISIVLIGLVLVGIFLYSIVDLIRNPEELILSEDGISIRNHGWNHWSLVDSIWIELEKDQENSDKEYLIVKLKGGGSIKKLISSLDKTSFAIYNLVNAFKSHNEAQIEK